MSNDLLAKLEAQIGGLAPPAIAELDSILDAELSAPWLPNPGPQTEAFYSPADVLLYGGQAGGGKSHLLLGLASTVHHRSLILRREAAELDGLIEDSRAILGGRARFNGQKNTWRSTNRILKFGGCKEPTEWRKYAGAPRDLLGLDEAESFLEEQVVSLMGWIRSDDPNQRCRTVLATNPPRSSQGRWIIEWFAPWLDPMFPNPAEPGELRWCIYVAKKIEWVEGPGSYDRNGLTYEARSHSFIPADLDSNPYYRDSDYKQRLSNLDPVLRAQLLEGDFTAGGEDLQNQVIPTEWIRAAQARWKPEGRNQRMLAIVADIAINKDKTCAARLHAGAWFDELITKPGFECPDGPEAAAMILLNRRDNAIIGLDCTGGYGGATRAHLLTNNTIEAIAFIASAASQNIDPLTGFGFKNLRAESWWEFREALRPGSKDPVALPPSKVLLAQLAAPTYTERSGKILIESKDDIKVRLGSSTDEADAIIMAWKIRGRAVTAVIAGGVPGQTFHSTKAKLGHAAKKKMRR